MNTFKSDITGKAEPPESFADFSPDKRQAYRVGLEKCASLLEHAARLILLQTEAPQVQVVTIDQPNLYLMAALYYGDVNKWRQLADMSDLSIAVYNTTEDIKIVVE
jgi:hypothetical protein